MIRLRRFWFQFREYDKPSALNLGCGVTAYSYDDALSLLRERVFLQEDFPEIEACTEDIDVSTLGAKILSNIGIVVDRGIWFPRGYESH